MTWHTSLNSLYSMTRQKLKQLSCSSLGECLFCKMFNISHFLKINCERSSRYAILAWPPSSSETVLSGFYDLVCSVHTRLCELSMHGLWTALIKLMSWGCSSSFLSQHYSCFLPVPFVEILTSTVTHSMQHKNTSPELQSNKHPYLVQLNRPFIFFVLSGNL